jgi:hypothetical protein
MTQNTIPALKALATLTETASSGQRAVSHDHSPKVAFAKSAVSFTVLSTNATQLVLQDNANKQRIKVSTDALQSSVVPKSGDTLILINATDKQISFRLLSASQGNAQSQSAALTLPVPLTRAVAQAWPDISASALTKAPLPIAAQLKLEAQSNNGKLDNRLVALAKLVAQSASASGRPSIELPIIATVKSLASAQNGNVNAVLNVLMANGKNIELLMPVPQAKQPLIKTGAPIELILSGNTPAKGIVAVRLQNTSLTPVEVSIVNKANPGLSSKVTAMIEQALFVSNKSSGMQSSGASSSANGIGQNYATPVNYTMPLKNSVLNALPSDFKQNIKSAIPAASMSDAQLLISSGKSIANNASVGSVILSALEKPQIIKVASEAFHANSQKQIAGLEGITNSKNGAASVGGAVTTGVATSGIPNSGPLSSAQAQNGAGQQLNSMLGNAGGVAKSADGAFASDNAKFGAALNTHADVSPNATTGKAGLKAEAVLQSAFTATLLQKVKSNLSPQAFAELPAKLQTALQHTLSHSAPTGESIDVVKTALEKLVVQGSVESKQQFAPLLQQLKSLSAVNSEATKALDVANIDRASKPDLKVDTNAELTPKTKLDASGKDSAELAQLIKQTMSAEALTQITTPLAQSSAKGQNSFIEGLVTLLKLSLAANLVNRADAQSTARQSMLQSSIPTFIAGIVKANSSQNDKPQPAKVLQDLSRIDPRGSLISEIGKLLSSHNTQKLRSAEASLQGNDTYYYALPNLLNKNGQDIEIAIRRETEREKEDEANAEQSLSQVWKLDIKLDVGKYGKVLAKTKLQNNAVDLHLYASDEALKARVLKYLPMLHARLKALGIEVNAQRCDVGNITPSLLKTQLNVMHTYA